MIATLRLVVLPILLSLALPALAQKTSEPQPMAGPGESTEPPKPMAAPVGAVQEQPLPKSGGILVFGGTRGTGLEVVKALVAKKENVTVVTHGSGENAELKARGVTLVSGNALQPDTIKDIFKATPFRVVISTVGAKRGEASPDFDGNKNVIDAAKAAKITRFVLVTVIGAGDSEKAAPWISRVILKDIIAAKTKAEDYLRASGLEYTIIRPGGLLDKPASGKAVLVADPGAFSYISRADLGKLVADAATDDKMIGKVLTSFDGTRTSVMSFFGKG